MVIAFSKQILLPQLVEEVEALVAQEAILLAYNLGLSHFVFKRDNGTVVQALTIDHCMSLFGNIVEDTKAASSLLQSHCFVHTRRQGNTITHILARKAKDF